MLTTEIDPEHTQSIAPNVLHQTFEGTVLKDYAKYRIPIQGVMSSFKGFFIAILKSMT